MCREHIVHRRASHPEMHFVYLYRHYMLSSCSIETTTKKTEKDEEKANETTQRPQLYQVMS